MTLGVAWKKEGSVYLICDSVSSYFENDEESTSVTSFGEREGRYGNTFSVKEDIKKLITLNENGYVSFAGDDVEEALEIIERLKLNLEYKSSIEECIESEKISSQTSEIIFNEFLIILKDSGEPKIYYFNTSEYTVEIIEEFKMIGSSQRISGFENELHSYIDELKLNKDEEMLFVDVLSSIQCASISNFENFLTEGVGGHFVGGYITNENIVKCIPDLFYLFEDKQNHVAIIARGNDTVLYSSFENRTLIYNESPRKNNLNKSQIEEYILKKIYTNIPSYVVRYDRERNVKHSYFIDKKSLVNGFYYRQIRLGHVSTNIYYKFDEALEELFENDINLNDIRLLPKSKVFILPELDLVSSSYMIEEEVPENVELPKTFGDARYFDFPFEMIIPNIFGISGLEQLLDKKIKSFENIILIDGDFFEKILMERVQTINTMMKEIRFDLESIIYRISNIASKNIDDYIFILSGDEKKYGSLFNDLIVEWNKMGNFFTLNYNIEYCIFDLIKSYYSNEEYFHVDKLIIISDCEEASSGLSIAPFNNRYSGYDDYSKLDIILGRNYNGETNMDGRFSYFVLDLDLWSGFGLDSNEIKIAENIYGEELGF